MNTFKMKKKRLGKRAAKKWLKRGKYEKCKQKPRLGLCGSQIKVKMAAYTEKSDAR